MWESYLVIVQKMDDRGSSTLVYCARWVIALYRGEGRGWIGAVFLFPIRA